MLKAFYNPAEAILDAKKLGEWASTIIVMACSGIFLSLAPMLIFREFLWKASLAALAIFIAGAFIGGIASKIAYSILGAKNPGYFECLTSGVYAVAPFSAAMLIGSALNLIPKVGLFLFMLSAAIGGIAMAAAYLRAAKELLNTDMLTAIVGAGIISGAGLAAAYLVYSLKIFLFAIAVMALVGMSF